MKKHNAKDILKSFSWTYILFAILLLILGIVFAVIPDFNEVAKEYTDVENPLFAFEVQIVVDILIYFWYFYLVRRFVSGKSKGTLYMVLLIIGVVGGIISMFVSPTKGSGTIDFTLDIVALYFVTRVKKENEA